MMKKEFARTGGGSQRDAFTVEPSRIRLSCQEIV
jgi:hypothetical protein